MSTNPNSLCFTFFTSPPDTWPLPVSGHMYHMQNGSYASGLLAIGQATSVLRPNDKASYMALPRLLVETTPCHLSSFLLFPTTPVACLTHCFLMDWEPFQAASHRFYCPYIFMSSVFFWHSSTTYQPLKMRVLHALKMTESLMHWHIVTSQKKRMFSTATAKIRKSASSFITCFDTIVSSSGSL